jgi:hypothetical protein
VIGRIHITTFLAALSVLLLACAAPEPQPEPAADGAKRPGKWKPMRERQRDLTPEEQARRDELAALGYVAGSQEARSDEIITVYDPTRAQQGYNFYVAGHAPTAYLMDMDGKVLHEWHTLYQDIWDDYIPYLQDAGMDSWRRAYLFENGDLLAIFERFAMIKLDKDSNLLWAKKNGAHHDIEVAADGSIYTLVTEQHLNPRVHESEEIWEDYLVQLDEGGEELRRCSMVDAFDAAGIDWQSDAKARAKGDIMHTNSLTIVRSDQRPELPWLTPGLILTSSRTLSLLSFVDMDACRVVKSFKGDWFRQHDPQMLPSGTMMLFDNRGLRAQSRVLEVDPASGRTVWEYRGSEEMPFYSEWCGSASRLANGNTLINETDQGRSFELAPDGEIVWEFYNPHRVGEDPPFIATLYDLVRLPADFPIDWARTQP